ncbi:MAG: PAS domain S-box protein [Limnothrix sp. CACIAM 69d]|nr:MAG: PAS domain S-box protein [Limnothrix sp. CACIAM 69d]
MSLTYLAKLSSARNLDLQRVAENQNLLRKWSNFAPTNYLHKFYLVEAEQHRILEQMYAAMDYYDRAIAGAKENGYIQEEALANELAAKFYLNWGREKVATSYMQEAYYCYARWGAKAKVADLEQRYPQLLQPILKTDIQSLTILETLTNITAPGYAAYSTSRKSSSSNIHQSLDLATLLQISQTFASTIALDELLQMLAQTMLENSGADRCALMLCDENQWQVRVMADLEQVTLQSVPLDNNRTVPVKLIQYVKNTMTTVVIDDLQTDFPVIGDYLNYHHPKSVLCLPVLNQGSLHAILYLENQSTSGVFTSDRVAVLSFLCTQAAISLRNADLYQTLQGSEAKFRRLVEGADDMIWSALADSTLTYLSPQFEPMFKLSLSDWVGQSFVKLVHPDDIEIVTASATAALETGKSQKNIEFRHLCQGKEYLWVTVNVTPIKNLQGQSIGLQGIIRDISDRKAAEAIIQQKSQDLENTLQELQSAQLQMVQSEKMASLGNLVAGVAHEINNPIGFLNGSINNGKEHVQDLLEHLALYQQHYPSPTSPIQDHAEDIDLEYVCEDLPQLLNSMQGATDRIKSISTSLRTFSRADTEYKVSANLHEGIDSTLLILKYRFKANQHRPAIEVITNYGEIPPIDCFPGQLNQVFMNILANAIDMFDEAAQGRSFKELEANPQQITISTVLIDQQVQISIRDNGKGMNAEVQSRIFDHLFTTKSVGKGTGLGLAIAQQIVVDKHSGSLTVESEPGQGAEFRIQLPIEG